MYAEKRTLSIAAGQTSLSVVWKKGGQIWFESYVVSKGES